MFRLFHINKKFSARILAGILPVLAVLVFSVFFFSTSTPDANATHKKSCTDGFEVASSLPCPDGSAGTTITHTEPNPPATPAGGSPANRQGVAAQRETQSPLCNRAWDVVTEFESCLVEGARIVILGISGIFFFFGGALLDAFMALSLSSTFIKQEGFVDFGWVLIRDVANTAFIFVLLYIAIMTILRAKSTNTKEMLVALIISALLVNFSLYLTRVVIDASNIVAIEFYQKIGTGGQPLVNIQGIQSRSISDAFLDVSNASIERKVFEAFGGENKETIKALAVIVAGGIFNVMGFFVLLSAAFLFLARAVTLWFVMIFSPLAFVAAILPIGSNIWSKWKSTLFSQAFFAPIFLFFLYLTFAFLKQDLFRNTLGVASTGGWLNDAAAFVVEIVVETFIPFIVVFAVLSYGLTTARTMAGASGAMAEKFGKLGVGAIVGAAAGTAAFAGRNLGGRGLRRFSETESGQKLQRWLERSGATRFIGADKWIGKAAGASYDARGLKKIQAGLGAVGGTGFNVGQAGAGHLEGLQKQQKLRQEQYNNLKGDPAAQARYFNSLSFRDKQAIHKNLSVSDQFALHEEVQRLPGYNDRAWHDLSAPELELERIQEKQASLTPKLSQELQIERAKKTVATVDDAGNITESVEDKRLAQLAEIPDTDMRTRRKVLAALSARDVADLHQRAGAIAALGGTPAVSQNTLTGLVSRMGAEEQEKFHSEILKREADVAKQAVHLVGITDPTVRQNVFNNLNTDLRSKLFHEGERLAVGGATATQIELKDRISGLNPAERVRTEQDILKRFTGATADAGRAQRIAAISAINPVLGQEIWTGTDARVRAQALESGVTGPALTQIQSLEGALSQTERDRTSDSRAEVRQAKQAIGHRQTLDTATATTPAATITNAIRNLDSKQIARLNSSTFTNSHVRANLKLNDLTAIYDRGDLPLPETKKLVEEYVRRVVPIALTGDKASKSQLKSLSTRNDKLFNLLDPADQQAVANAV